MASTTRVEAMACGDGGGGRIGTVIEDLPADVLGLVLRRLDGARVRVLGLPRARQRPGRVARALPRHVAVGPRRALLRRRGRLPGALRRRVPVPVPGRVAGEVDVSVGVGVGLSLPSRLVSAVDLHHGGVCIMSRVVETDTSSAWFLGSPFRVDALVQEGFSSPSPVTPSDLMLSWILIDPATGSAVNVSSRRAVSVDRKWLTGDTVVRFNVVLGDDVALDAAVTCCGDRYGHGREVSLCAGDAEDGVVSGRDGLAAVAAAMAGARRCRGAEEAARRLYEEFTKGKRARKEWKARREGIVDLCCSSVGAAAFLAFLVMLTFW